MAVSNSSHGYKCQFRDNVSENLFCKQCKLVARGLTITSCCGESYCSACIHAVEQDSKPCPHCGAESFSIFPHVKNQGEVLALKVHCSLKEKGCVWFGTLKELDAHLDTDTGMCPYTEVNCPLNGCGNKMIRKNLQQHKTKECLQRQFVCPHCSSFRSTYQIVTKTHWPQCSYFPLTCPNECGVTYERLTMQEHLLICQLQEVECQFKEAGCEGRFRREEEQQHMREESQTHLNMIPAALLKMKQLFQEKLEEYESKLSVQLERKLKEKFKAKLEEEVIQFQEQANEQERKFQQKFEEQENKQEGKLKEMKSENERLERQIEELGKQFALQQTKISELLTETKLQLEKLAKVGPTYHKFSLKYQRDLQQSSPAMYTHVGGYRFYIHMNTAAKAQGVTLGGVALSLRILEGDYDDVLQWPVTLSVTLQLVEEGRSKTVTLREEKEKPDLKCRSPERGQDRILPSSSSFKYKRFSQDIQPDPDTLQPILDFEITNIELGN